MTGGETYEGYLYEPNISDYPHMSANMEDEPNSSGSDIENLDVLWRESRIKMARAEWCYCGNCVVQKTDDECFCCQEHELLKEKLSDKQCVAQLENLEAYVCYNPSLEMAFIDGMIRNILKGSAPEKLSTR